jgi:hypothetical protein
LIGVTPASVTELPRENELLERQMTALAEMNAGDWRAQDAGLKLADFECKHGALPGDQGITCSCWDGEPVTLSIAA